MRSNCGEHVFVELGKSIVRNAGDRGSECLQSPHGSREADLPGVFSMPGRRLGDDRPDQVVCQQVCPELLAHHVGSLAAEHVPMQHDLEGTQVDFRIPAKTIQLCDLGLQELLRIEQRRGDDDRSGAIT